MIPKPESTDDAISQLWFVIIGSNGDGLASIVRDTRQRVVEIEEALPKFMTWEEYAEQILKKKENLEATAAIKREKSLNRWTAIGSLAFAAETIITIATLLHH